MFYLGWVTGNGNLSDNVATRGSTVSVSSSWMVNLTSSLTATICWWPRKYKVLLTTCKGFCFPSREKLVSLGFSSETKTSKWNENYFPSSDTFVIDANDSRMIMWQYVGSSLPAKYCLLLGCQYHNTIPRLPSAHLATCFVRNITFISLLISPLTCVAREISFGEQS